MTPQPAVVRCEVCTARVDSDCATSARRCGEHAEQIALFDPPPLHVLRAARAPRPGSRPSASSTSDTSGDRHHSRARRARTTKKD